jgi:hypothetical protein
MNVENAKMREAIQSAIIKITSVKRNGASVTAILKEIQNSQDMSRITPKSVSTTKEYLDLIRQLCKENPCIEQNAKSRYTFNFCAKVETHNSICSSTRNG